MDTEESVSGGSPPPLLVRVHGHDRSLPGDRSYLIGRDPQCDIVLTDDRVSWHHAGLRPEDGRWLLVDNGSTNGTYTDGRRVARIEIGAECVARLGHPADGPVLTCTVAKGGPPPPPGRTVRIGRAPDNDIVVDDPGVSRHHAELRGVAGSYRIVDLASHNGTFVNGRRGTDAPLAEGDVVGIGPASFRLAGQELRRLTDTSTAAQTPPPAAVTAPPPSSAAVPAPPASATPPGRDALVTATAGGAAPIEIPYAVRWLVPNGERFANFDILNDNDTQLGYYRRFGHIYAVGIPAKKWRLVVVSDPELLDEVAGDEEQFAKRVEDINFFDQLSNSRGGGISVISDGALGLVFLTAALICQFTQITHTHIHG